MKKKETLLIIMYYIVQCINQYYINQHYQYHYITHPVQHHDCVYRKCVWMSHHVLPCVLDVLLYILNVY